ncbi:nitroreductase family deazaflavin-dependent oxidoreductase [Nocardia panacis]|uniref:Nitroreductase family deazaflavin-dependent oxidoreductase n=1 Tax=Nocardia panacis TaxID=2340916 RepID=A0A3A4JZX2_9NOCA|nr:nitroreductase family deazaflavin-dependent oxidoreductase [Nocardia panacis]RJO69081.1 nitroreductase family deazaflavin-dependent oxidoreductase [Nocardia panacis]
MSFHKIPNGTRGGRPMPSNPLTHLMMRGMQRLHRWQGDRFQGMDLLYLTTIGAQSGQERHVTISRVADGDGWLVAASYAGAVKNPAWYNNVAAHPDRVWVEFGGEKFRVNVEQLEGEARERAWQKMGTAVPRYFGYEQKTDRTIPVLRLTRATQ